MKRLILASGSPQRAELLKKLVPQFEITVSGVPEIGDGAGLSFEAVAMLNAKTKAAEVFRQYTAMGIDCTVLGADTVVVSAEGNRLLEKPRDIQEAKAHLMALSGKMHKVITGYYVVGKYKNVMDYDTSTVTMKKLDPAAVESYVADGHTLNKSGGYAIQEIKELGFTEKIEGSLDNIIGLPTEKLKTVLTQF